MEALKTIRVPTLAGRFELVAASGPHLGQHPCEGFHVLFGGRFLLRGCGFHIELARSSRRLLGGHPSTSESVLVRATGADTAWSPRPRIPHVRYRSTRALFGGVPRKGTESWLAALAKAPSRIANRARSSCSTEVRRERRTPMGSGRCVPARSSRLRVGGSTSLDEGWRGHAARRSSANGEQAARHRRWVSTVTAAP